METRSLEELKSLYIGKNVKGFKYKGRNDILFTERMEDYIGQSGVIKQIEIRHPDIVCLVDFKYPEPDQWWYLLKDIENNLEVENIDLKDLFKQIKNI